MLLIFCFVLFLLGFFVCFFALLLYLFICLFVCLFCLPVGVFNERLKLIGGQIRSPKGYIIYLFYYLFTYDVCFS